LGSEPTDAEEPIDAESEMLPNFIIIGAMKAGTSSLHLYLQTHPDVFMSFPKEPEYFVEKSNWKKGQGWYESLFRDAGPAIAIGEASTSYTKYPNSAGVPERIARLIPDVRLIYVVRHPIERIRSHYEHSLREGWESRPLSQAVLQDSRYVNFSRYAFQIEQYLKVFEREQLLVVTAEELRESRVLTLRKIFEFLGVDVDHSSESLWQKKPEFHVTRGQARTADRWLKRLPGFRRVAKVTPHRLKSIYRKFAEDRARISMDVRKTLESRLAEDVAQLRDLVGADVDGWRFPET
jgi:hypothetical protein